MCILKKQFSPFHLTPTNIYHATRRQSDDWRRRFFVVVADDIVNVVCYCCCCIHNSIEFITDAKIVIFQRANSIWPTQWDLFLFCMHASFPIADKFRYASLVSVKNKSLCILRISIGLSIKSNWKCISFENIHTSRCVNLLLFIAKQCFRICFYDYLKWVWNNILSGRELFCGIRITLSVCILIQIRNRTVNENKQTIQNDDCQWVIINSLIMVFMFSISFCFLVVYLRKTDNNLYGMTLQHNRANCRYSIAGCGWWCSIAMLTRT